MKSATPLQTFEGIFINPSHRQGVMEAPIVVMDDEFLERFSKNFAEKATPIYQEMMNEKYQVMRKYTYYACWCSFLLGSALTMMVAKVIMGAY
jgi:hypothetical protein